MKCEQKVSLIVHFCGSWGVQWEGAVSGKLKYFEIKPHGKVQLYSAIFILKAIIKL